MRVPLISTVFAIALVAVPSIAAPAGSMPISESSIEALSGQGPVLEFYRHRNFAPAWRSDQAAALIAVLVQAVDEGLDPKDYLPIGGDDTNTRDIALTEAALGYIRDVRDGRPALRGLDQDVALPASDFDAAADLNRAIQTGDLRAYLASLPPPGEQYAHLRSSLAAYRAIRDHGGWPQISMLDVAPMPSRDHQASRLRKRLAYEDPTVLSELDLSAALKRFQGRHGLEVDGRLGNQTIAALNISAEERTQQIIANMERWRWQPRGSESDFIMVNVPDASLSLVLGGHEVLSSRVIVGKRLTPTPILRAEGGGLTVNPPWNVPASIARKEILVKLKINPSYLRSQDMVLLNGPPGDPYGLHVRWRAIPANSFPYLIQQHPGSANQLGTIKLELPNRFDVYLHDTPAKGAFARGNRDVSHGCVRVERILPLASYILSQDLSAMETIANAVSSGETRYFPLRKRLPVYFLYWTAFTAADGVLQFRPDIYGRDKRQAAALEGVLKMSALNPNCSKG
jgi:murein L,D-transpeptidase YcbB/YkuD